MAMKTTGAWIIAAGLICVVAVVSVGGCGGGGAGPAPVIETQIQQSFLLDFVKNTVTVIATPTMGTAMVEANPGGATAELALTLRIAPEGISQPGDLGRRHIFAQIKNNSSGATGQTDLGGASAIELNFTSALFQTAANAVVPGGGFARQDAFDPTSGTPIYYFSPATVGAVAGERQVDLWLPPTATQAILTAIVRAYTERYNPPSLDRFWVSTSAGKPGQYAWVDGPAWEALFGTHATMQGLTFRETLVDAIICDPAYNRVRLLSSNPVTKKPEVFTVAGDGTTTTLNEPVDVCQDIVGNVYVSEHNGACVSIIPAGTGLGGLSSASTIVGSRNNPGDALGSGSTARLTAPWGIGAGYNAVYVCDGAKIRKITTTSPGSTYGWNYQVSNLDTTGLVKPMDIAVDEMGNKYVSDAGAKKVFICLRRSTAWVAIAGGGASTDGTGAVAKFTAPGSISVGTGGVVWLSDNGTLRRLRPRSTVLTAAANWQVDTIPLIANSSADGADGKAGRRAVRGVTTSRSGTIGFTDDGAVRRLDMTSS